MRASMPRAGGAVQKLAQQRRNKAFLQFGSAGGLAIVVIGLFINRYEFGAAI